MNNNIKKQSNLFVALSSFLCLVMVISVFASDLRFKPTYSATDSCDNDECLNIWCPYGSTPCAGTQCFECPKGDIIVYIYDKNAEDAKKNMKATGNCSATSNTYCQEACIEVCYECDKGNGKAYVFAIGAPNAESLSGGTNCVQTTSDKCTAPAAPIVTNCYECNKNGVKNYLYSTSASKAEQLSGGTNCVVTSNSNCETTPTIDDPPAVNPPTGTTFIVVAWIIGVFAIGYAIWYFVKLRKIK